MKKLLIANRGEIAVRIIRTAKNLGIKTVAVFSDPDAHSLFVKLADEAFALGGTEARSSYLNQEKILEAIQATKADAVHPGYGFLSENASFAEQLASMGILFLGPTPSSIRAMGDKIESRLLVEKVGVPVIPGYDGDDQSIEAFQKAALEIGYPIMAKASAGGGGKGMRRIDSPEELEAKILSAKREALSAFGEDRILLEKYIQYPKHIEFQIFGDTHGNLIHLHERDCSAQRRHQKVIEESPAFGLPNDIKEKMAKAALQAAKAVDYVGAGTVEFIYSQEQGFYFLEMNTRLQVEHPVTEMTTGLDLVEWQIRVARGEVLPLLHPPEQKGHSIEVRLYAEDPSEGFLPATGTIHYMEIPTGQGIRLDAGVESGSEISIFYDPMIAKLIVWADTRDNALQKMLTTLQSAIVFGPKTNLSFLQNLIQREEFQTGRVYTDWIGTTESELTFVETSSQLLALVGEYFSEAESLNPWKVIP